MRLILAGVLALACALAHAQAYLAITSASQITPNISASRTSGADPLCVVFNASATISALTSQPYYELDYAWDFGEPSSPAFSTGTRTSANGQNTAYGPIAAHCFTGNATVTLTVRHGANTAQTTQAITVTAADTQWSGTATLCVRQTAGGSFTGCPGSADQVTDADFDNVINTRAGNGATYKRVLFECDGTYTASSGTTINSPGPGYIGAYPAGCSARARPIVSGSHTIVLGFTTDDKATFGDWRFVDLDIYGVDNATDVFNLQGPATRLSWINNRIRSTKSGFVTNFQTLNDINVSSALVPMWNQFVIYGNTFDSLSGGNAFGLLMAMTDSAFLGNNFTNHTGTHAFRSDYLKNVVISNNEIDAPSVNSAALTVRGQEWEVADRDAGGPNAFTLPAHSYTEKVVIAENVITNNGGSASPFSVRAVLSIHDARFRHIIVESNYADSNLATEANSATIRNNIFDLGAGGDPFNKCVAMSANAAPASSYGDIYVYNNSCYTSGTPAAFGVESSLASGGGTIAVNNNLTVGPNITAADCGSNQSTTSAQVCAVHNTGTATITATNNSTGTQIKGTSPLSTTPPTLTSHYQPAAATYPIDAGTSVPVWRDFFQALRTGTYDIGAVNP